MNCPECNSHKKQWLGRDSFECKECGWFYADPVLGATLEYQEIARYQESIRCPGCGELTEGIGENLEHLENLHTYNDGFRDTKGWFHPDCWIGYQKGQENQKLIEHKQLNLMEKVSQIPCPHCHQTGIYLESSNESITSYYGIFVRPYWECMSCDKKIDKKWLFPQIRGRSENTQTKLSALPMYIL